MRLDDPEKASLMTQSRWLKPPPETIQIDPKMIRLYCANAYPGPGLYRAVGDYARCPFLNANQLC